MNFQWSVACSLLAGGVFTLLGPLVLAWVVKKKTAARFYWFLLGAATFFVSQCILRLPWQIPLAMWIGKRIAGHAVLQVLWMATAALTASLFEECGRYVTFRYWMKERSWRAGLMVGAGHGGIEAMLLIAPNLIISGVHVALSVIVADGFARGRPLRGLGFALLGHFLLDFAGAGGAILLAKRTGSSLAGEVALLPALVVAILVIRALRPANISGQ